jgi:hypothetical protein
MTTVRERLWLWGHEAGSHDGHFNLPGKSRMTPAEAAFYLDIPNLIMVRYDDKPAMPFDQLALALRPLHRVHWSVVGAMGRSTAAETEHVLDLATRFPNITGVFLDDFFRDGAPDTAQSAGTESGALPLAELQALRNRLVVAGRRLDLGVTLYTHQLEQPLGPYLDHCDLVSLWTWKSPDLEHLEAHMSKCEALAPHSVKFLGLYLWDYGLKQPMPLELMQMQAELGLRWLRDGRVGGLIFLASCICDLGLETVEWSRAWIRQVGDAPLG